MKLTVNSAGVISEQYQELQEENDTGTQLLFWMHAAKVDEWANVEPLPRILREGLAQAYAFAHESEDVAGFQTLLDEEIEWCEPPINWQKENVLGEWMGAWVARQESGLKMILYATGLPLFLHEGFARQMQHMNGGSMDGWIGWVNGFSSALSILAGSVEEDETSA